jgi:hypothetical protein
MDDALKQKDENVLGAIARGTTDGLHLAINVAAMLISFLALIALANLILSSVHNHLAWFPASLERIFGVIFALGVAALLVRGGLRTRRGELFLIFYAIVPLLIVYAITASNPKFAERYMIIISPAFYLVLARGLAALYSGYRTARELALAGLAEGTEGELESAEAVFAGAFPWMRDGF